jgi:hypothetical protein
MTSDHAPTTAISSIVDFGTFVWPVVSTDAALEIEAEAALEEPEPEAEP